MVNFVVVKVATLGFPTLLAVAKAITNVAFILSTVAHGASTLSVSIREPVAITGRKVIVSVWRRYDTFNEAIEQTHFNINSLLI